MVDAQNPNPNPNIQYTVDGAVHKRYLDPRGLQRIKDNPQFGYFQAYAGPNHLYRDWYKLELFKVAENGNFPDQP